MKKEDKERVVADLTEKLRASETLIVADYRGLTMPEIDKLRGKLLEHGARFAVVKNTLTRRAAEAAGADALLALLEGPTAIAFLESGGDPVAVAKALADAARETKILEIRGGLLEGRVIEAAEIEELAKLPPVDVLRSQVLGAVTSPLVAILGLFTAPLQNLHGLIDARIQQLDAGEPPASNAAEAEEPEETTSPASTEPHAPDEINTASTEPHAPDATSPASTEPHAPDATSPASTEPHAPDAANTASPEPQAPDKEAEDAS